MPFCTNCGQRLRENAKFCDACGTPVTNRRTSRTETRRQEYEGKVVKCPQCGQEIPSFSATCPTCGHEFRGSATSDSVKEFFNKLEHTSSDSAKAILIRTFPIPNTREDILEFMILASTNIENSFQQEVSEAWSVKFEQAFEKSKILYGDEPQFSRCYELFQRKKSANRRAVKAKERNLDRLRKKEHAGRFFERNKSWVLAVCVVLAILILFGAFFIPRMLKVRQLENLVKEVETQIDHQDFEAARRTASQIIDDGGWSTESTKKWDDIRESLLEAITREEILAGEKVLTGVDADDVKGKDYSEIVTYFQRQGFTNVQTEAIADLVTGWITSDGEVEKVTIDGASDFEKDSTYEADAEIIVFYHTFK